MRKKSKETDSVPAHLDQAGATFFATMREGYGIEDGAGIALLTRAALLTGSNKRSRRFASMVP